MLIQYPLLEILKNLTICWFNTLYWKYWKTYLYVDSIPSTGNIEKLTYMLIQYPLLEILENLPICWFNTLYWKYWKTYLYVDSIPSTGNAIAATREVIQWKSKKKNPLSHVYHKRFTLDQKIRQFVILNGIELRFLNFRYLS